MFYSIFIIFLFHLVLSDDDIEILANSANTHSWSSVDRSLWAIRNFKARIRFKTEPKRILSYGCSRGDEVRSLRKFYPNAEIIGTDIKFGFPEGEEIWKEANSKNKMDDKISYIPIKQLIHQEKFDILTCMFVFYHSMTKVEFFKTIQFWPTLLNPEGIILLDFYKNKMDGKKEKFDYNLVLNWIMNNVNDTKNIENNIPNIDFNLVSKVLVDDSMRFGLVGNSKYHDLVIMRAVGVPVFQFVYNPNGKVRVFPNFKFRNLIRNETI